MSHLWGGGVCRCTVWISSGSAHTASHNCAHKSRAFARAKQPHPSTPRAALSRRENELHEGLFSPKQTYSANRVTRSGFRNAFGSQTVWPTAASLWLCTLRPRCAPLSHLLTVLARYGRSTTFRTNTPTLCHTASNFCGATLHFDSTSLEHTQLSHLPHQMRITKVVS